MTLLQLLMEGGEVGEEGGGGEGGGEGEGEGGEEGGGEVQEVDRVQAEVAARGK